MNSVIQIYNQNISGGTRKLTNFNHKLATTHFDIIMLQETWFSDKISTQEIIHSTDFIAFRKDRDFDLNNRTRGGGVMTLVNKELSVINIDLILTTIADIKALLIRKYESDLILINVYSQGNKIDLTNELIQILRKIKTKFIGVNILVIGDFNIGIKWTYSPDYNGFLVPSNNTISRSDRYFYQNISDVGLYQINNLVNSRGNSLDLVFG